MLDSVTWEKWIKPFSLEELAARVDAHLRRERRHGGRLVIENAGAGARVTAVFGVE